LLTQAMKSPAGAANILEQLPTAERNKVLSLMADPTKWSTKTGLTGSAVLREAAQSLTEE